MNKEDPALGRQTNSSSQAVKALTPGCGLPPSCAHLAGASQGCGACGGCCGPGILGEECARALLLSRGGPGVQRELADRPFLKLGGPASSAHTQKGIGSPDQLWSKRQRGEQASRRRVTTGSSSQPLSETRIPAHTIC